MLNVLLLASGELQASADEYQEPHFLTEFNGRSLIELITDKLNAFHSRNLIFAFKDKDIKRYGLDKIVSILDPKAAMLKNISSTKGAACTALLAVDYIDNQDELLIINCNEYFDVDYPAVIESFKQRSLDCGCIVFKSIHPRYSYVSLNESGLVTMASEKKTISNNATAGFYWFKNGSDFIKSAEFMIKKEDEINGNYYVCPTFNQMLLQHKLIGVYEISNNLYHPLKNTKQLASFDKLSSF